MARLGSTRRARKKESEYAGVRCTMAAGRWLQGLQREAARVEQSLFSGSVGFVHSPVTNKRRRTFLPARGSAVSVEPTQPSWRVGRGIERINGGRNSIFTFDLSLIVRLEAGNEAQVDWKNGAPLSSPSSVCRRLASVVSFCAFCFDHIQFISQWLSEYRRVVSFFSQFSVTLRKGH